jgi:uncharacterized protein
MARAPGYGRGKTRLATGLGRSAALRINRLLQAHTLRVARNARCRVVLAVTPGTARAMRLPGVWPETLTRKHQGGGDLGARLARVMKTTHGPVAVIGADCPALRTKHITDAFHALGKARVAIGPARDGGFWLLAARRSADVIGAFDGVRWSSAHTRGDLIARLRVPHLLLETLEDVDTADDWRRLRNRLRR